MSAIVAVFPAMGSFLYKKNIQESFDEFIYSFLGGLLGGFIGTTISFMIGHICYSLGFFQPDFGFPDLRIVLLWLFGLCIGVLIGGITTIKPIIRFCLDN
ncbi:MAG: hypothetical protein AAF383_22545 [Cyanobacteria bacterium P01_A01_bin.83]